MDPIEVLMNEIEVLKIQSHDALGVWLRNESKIREKEAKLLALLLDKKIAGE